ncbi:hypothetical protein [Streptomyces sp. bgisy027]|uniref:hypothetical protein n=1 Tax=unclassified Streptomyces TaxID=2593676 RepID=UPI003D747C9E
MGAEASPAARTGAFVAVAVALFCIQLDLFALNPAVPGTAVVLVVRHRLADTAGTGKIPPTGRPRPAGPDDSAGRRAPGGGAGSRPSRGGRLP